MGQEFVSKKSETNYKDKKNRYSEEFSRNKNELKTQYKKFPKVIKINEDNNKNNNEILFSHENFYPINEENQFQIHNTEPNQYKEDNLKKIECPKCNKFYNHKYYNYHFKVCKKNQNNNNNINNNSRNKDLNDYQKFSKRKSNTAYSKLNSYSNNNNNSPFNGNFLVGDNNNDKSKRIYKKPKISVFNCTKCNKNFKNKTEYNNHKVQCNVILNNIQNLPLQSNNQNNNLDFFDNNVNYGFFNYFNPNNNNFNNNFNNNPNNILINPLMNNFNNSNNNNLNNFSNNNLNNNINHHNNPLQNISQNNKINNIIFKEPKQKLPKGNSNRTFEEKVQSLRINLKKKKIDWRKGCDKISINRENILEESMNQFENINPYKELKIDFKGEVSEDAGGLIREWLTVLFDILLEKCNLFEKSDTNEISYIIKKNINITNKSKSKFTFIGKLLAKALLENLTVNCCFNKIIFQILLNEIITLDDLVFIDKPLYTSLKNLIEMNKKGEDISILELYFSIQYKDSKNKLITNELIENGDSIQVKSENLDLYIQKRIEYLIKTQKKSVNLIKQGFNSIIPIKELLIFNSDQLSLLINGTPFIDVDDWRINTTYKNYEELDEVITIFWDILSNLSQEELSKFLLFCTGSTRVPIGGFKTLESNRGNICKFSITKIEYYPKQKNFIRAHTCFNRLDLPNFPNREKIKEAIKFAIENETLGFGID